SFSQGLSFRGEAHHPRMPVFLVNNVEERLDAEWISRAEKLTAQSVPDSEREHAPQPVHDILAVPGVSLEENFGIRIRPQLHSLVPQFVAELYVVVDLTVENHAVASVGGTHRLVATCRQVDDR